MECPTSWSQRSMDAGFVSHPPCWGKDFQWNRHLRVIHGPIANQ